MSDKKKEKNKVAAVRRDTGQDGTVALAIQAMGGQLGEALNKTIGPLVNEMKASNQRVQDSLEELNGRFRLADVQAAAEDEEDDEEDEKEADEEESSHKRMSCKGCEEDGHTRNHHKHKSKEHKKEGIKKAMEKAKK